MKVYIQGAEFKYIQHYEMYNLYTGFKAYRAAPTNRSSLFEASGFDEMDSENIRFILHEQARWNKIKC